MGEGQALVTVGHGRLNRQRFGDLLAGAGIDLLVDVRRFPGSRTNPDVRREALAAWLPERGIAYRWEERLGGRRHRRAGEPEVDTWWTVPAFRAYAAYTRTEEFRAALDMLLADLESGCVAVMCSESMWWRCHRRLIADVVTLGRQVPVRHLMADGRTTVHRPSDGARVRSDGLLVWDGGT